MKKKILLLVMITMSLFVAGCSEQSSVSESIPSHSVVEKETSLTEVTEVRTVQNETPEDEFYRQYGLNMYYPSKWEEEIVGSSTMWNGTYSTNDIVYYFTNLNPFYERQKSELLQDVPSTMEEYIKEVVTECYDCYDSKYSCTVNQETEVEVQGYPFLRHEGVIHTETEDESADLHYVAYYGYLDFPQYNTVGAPVVWMAFSEAEEKDTLTDIAAVVDKTAELLTWEE